MKLEARPTLAACELDHGETVEFVLRDGRAVTIRVLDTSAEVFQSNLEEVGPGPLAKVVLRMGCKLEVDGHPVSLGKFVGSQQSFGPPWEFAGIRIWFDGARALFDHLTEDHGVCKPRKALRLAVQDARERICPVRLHPWCPLPKGGLRIEDCYQGSDCWLGPYFGVDAHGGLDINHPAGTPIWTPFSIDEQGFFNSVAAGDNNNRWRGIKRWPDGSAWVIQVHHVIRLRVEEQVPLDAGIHLADGAGVLIGTHEHSHFGFGVIEPGKTFEDRILLDPWILFEQMYRDAASTFDV